MAARLSEAIVGARFNELAEFLFPVHLFLSSIVWDPLCFVWSMAICIKQGFTSKEEEDDDDEAVTFAYLPSLPTYLWDRQRSKSWAAVVSWQLQRDW